MKRPGALELSAWLHPHIPGSIEDFEAQAPRLSRVYPIWYALGDEGLAARNLAVNGEERQRVILAAQKGGVEIWPVLSNFNERSMAWDPGRAARMLLEPRCAASHIRQAVGLAKADGAQGLCFDFKGLESTERRALPAFADLALAACHAAGLKLAMLIESPGDFTALAGRLDLLQLAALGAHGPGTGPGSLSPPDGVAAALKLALRSSRPEGLELVFFATGWEWNGPAVRPMDWNGWEARVAKHGPAKRDPASAELSLHYEGREAWFADSVSALRKLLKLRDAGVDKASFWVLGCEDPRLWEMLEDFPAPFLG